MTGKQKKRLMNAIQVTLILIAIFIMLVPILWIFLAAFKNHIDVFQLKLLFTPTLENFKTVFAPPYYLGRKLVNSTIVAFVTVLIAIPAATTAAYAFSRFRMVGETSMLVTVLATQFVPAVVIILPFFVMFRDLIDGIPLDTEEAAMIDGSSRLQVIRNIVLPMAAPGLLTAGIFCFIISWNEFLFALILTNKDSVTLPIGLALFKAEEGDLWNLLSAAGIIIMVPMFILALIIRNYFVQGMTMGAVR
jgi:multiple sugar transport system permease protein